MRMAVDIGIVRDACAAPQKDASAIVEENISVNHTVVFDGEVVAKGELDVVKDLYVVPDVLEDVPAKHGAETKAKPMIEPERRAIEHLPKIDQRFALGVSNRVHVAVVFRLQCDVARVQGQVYQAIGG